MPQTDRPQAPDCLTHLTGPHEWPPCPYCTSGDTLISAPTFPGNRERRPQPGNLTDLHDRSGV